MSVHAKIGLVGTEPYRKHRFKEVPGRKHKCYDHALHHFLQVLSCALSIRTCPSVGPLKLEQGRASTG